MELESSLPQDGPLAVSLSTLASPVRLALLRELRTPKTLREIRIRSSDEDARILSRQAIREHLDRLLEIGAISAQETEREYGSTVEYQVNHQRLFALSEEFRTLAKIRPSSELSQPTIGGPGLATAARSGLEGPCLVLVKGIDEGKIFPLPGAAGGSHEWIVGRKRSAGISLDFDPYVSSEHALIRCQSGAYSIEEYGDSRNGTFVNFTKLARGTRSALRHGDIIGVGRALLLFRDRVDAER